MLEFLNSYSTYIAVLLGIAAGFPIIWTHRNRVRISNAGIALLCCLLFSVISVFSVLLLASVEGFLGGEGLHFGGVSTYGIYLFAPLILIAIFHSRDMRKGIFDIYALYVMPSMVLQRIRCMITGCCYGRYMFGSHLRYPTRELEIIFYIVMFIIFLRMEKVGKARPGSLYPLLMICYGVFRFLTEFLRGDGTGVLHLAHLWSAIVIIVGASIFLEIKAHSRKKKA